VASHALPHPHRSGRKPRLSIRLVAWWRGARFDEALAAGEDPARDPRLAAHAARLARPHQISALAHGLERAVEAAERPQPLLSSAVPVRAHEVLASRDELLGLVALLRTTPNPPPRALALSRRLLLDGASPLFNPEAAGTLRGAVNKARLAFDPDYETYPPEA
jgi:hypothetical protein